MLNRYLLLFCLLLPCVASADLKDAFEVYTTTPSSSFDGRYMQGVVGASFHARNRNLFDREIYSVQLPSYNAGCGGIDIFSGSFSIITKDELVQIARGIAQGAPGYFFNMAIDSVCPNCGANMKELSKRLNSFNAMANDSCQQFWDGFSDMTGIKDAAGQLRSQMESKIPQGKAFDGLIPDFGAHMTDRSAPVDAGRTTPNGTTAEDVEHIENNAIKMLFESSESNYTDRLVIGLEPYELFMSLIGGVIVLDIGTDSDPNLQPSLPDASIDLKTLLFGPEPNSAGEIELTTCPDPDTPELAKCLSPNTETITWEGIIPKFSRLINDATGTGILQRIHKRQDINDEQKQFIVSYPYNYVNWAHQCFEHSGPQIAEYVATMVGLSAMKDVFNQISSDAHRNLNNSGLKPEQLVKPDQVISLIDRKRIEMNTLIEEARELSKEAHKTLTSEVGSAIKNGLCQGL